MNKHFPLILTVLLKTFFYLCARGHLLQRDVLTIDSASKLFKGAFKFVANKQMVAHEINGEFPELLDIDSVTSCVSVLCERLKESEKCCLFNG